MKKIALLVTERNDSYYSHLESYVVNIDDGKEYQYICLERKTQCILSRPVCYMPNVSEP